MATGLLAVVNSITNPIEDLERAEENYERAKEELDSTLAELTDI